ncbi:MAG TPA: hypothetical protein DHV16_05235 [Nitrospiraceae bacterium]|nr:MAG: hypothetical protein A2Z82_07835 [Nitrospirae bacterium GWA2_46_11]OGW25573.1 MAG: hypothetical protein A2X55_11405 [Nitrospirae bacterium GWB2_47_37]HAK88512.1 hypothetical protein [Nitrospiraceae bacterium]HCL81732.1 hypothetical protein [Nitrospiraceae bacterium]HCZ11649.1 hypothetical protein [Nitrospiraceae bacterium]
MENKIYLFIICILFLALAACARQPAYSEPPIVGNEVVIAAAAVKQDEPLFFTYRYKEKNISFFVVRINNEMFSFLDACQKCYPKKLGYKYIEGRVICRACNMGYPVAEIEKGFGSCIPIKIPGALNAGKYVIPVSTLEAMSDKF